MAKSILIVDDVPFVRKTLTQILTEAHYRVVGEASDGEEAIDLYLKLRPNLVTMDLVMPQMSGIEAARKILREDKDALIVMISAMGQENLVMEAINVGAADFLLKPFSREEVTKTISRVFSAVDKTSSRPTSRESKL